MERGTEGMYVPLWVLVYIAGSWMSPTVKPSLDSEIENLTRDSYPDALKNNFSKGWVVG
jgi:hypothetical protein